MCGIAGIFNFNRKHCDIRSTEVLLEKMTEAIAHRGPDGEGHSILDEGHVFFGHRRLAILDLSENAAQPMESIDGRYTIIYNGEIYNYKELRIELIDLGYKFFSQSDTEVVLNAYAEWKEDLLIKLNGIFAFAIWDNYRKKLLLANDRYGTKPLYYARIGEQLLFASEYKAIIKHPAFNKRINFCALKQYFTFQNIFDNSCLLEGIRLLPAGAYIVMDYNMETTPEPMAYWDYEFDESDECLSEKAYEEELDRLFQQAVKRQLVSDVEIGAYLSGGVDSGSITAIAAKNATYLKTFVCGFDLRSASGIELTFDERERAEYMSYLFGTEHYEMVLKSGDMERCIEKLVWHIEDPRVGQSYPNYYASKLASKFVKVVLAGTGGDELFGGYPWRYYRALNCNDFSEYVDLYYLYWQRLLDDNELGGIFYEKVPEMSKYSMKDIFGNVFVRPKDGEFTPEKCVNLSLYFEARTFLRGLLIVEDKLSMAYGLESRVPFLDNDLVDFTMKLPVKYKLANLENVMKINENDFGGKKNTYFKKTNDGKRILRKVMNKYIPDEITSATKQGFSAPDASWFKGESIEFVRSIAENKQSRIYDYMDYDATLTMVNKHLRGEENKRLLIWSIINFEEWLKIFL